MTYGERILKLGLMLKQATEQADADTPASPAYGELTMHLEALIVAHEEEHDLRQLAYNAARQRNAASYGYCEQRLKQIEKVIDELRLACKMVQQEIAELGG